MALGVTCDVMHGREIGFSMIIGDDDFFRARTRPLESDSPLFIYPVRVKARIVAFQGFQTVAGRHGHMLQSGGLIQLNELAEGNARDARKAEVLFRAEKLCVSSSEKARIMPWRSFGFEVSFPAGRLLAVLSGSRW